MSRLRRAARLAATATLIGAVLSGCAYNLQTLPPPGGAVSGPTFEVTAVFADVLNLPQYAQVKLDGVVVGNTTTITARNSKAYVGMALQQGLKLPVGTTAEIRFTTPLGEDYISLHRPAGDQAGTVLIQGSTIPESQTLTAVTIEDTFAALAALLNGGGLEQLKTIVTEVNRALEGHTADFRDLVTQLNRLVTALNGRQSDLDKALDSLNSLVTELDGQKDVVVSAITTLAPALRVLSDQTPQFAQLLTSLSNLGSVGTQVLDQSRSALLADLRELVPVVDTVVGVRKQLASFATDAVTFGRLLTRAIPGDFLQLSGTLCLSLVGDTGPAPPPPCNQQALQQSARTPSAALDDSSAAAYLLEAVLR
jgi:phospholipid/cholesterol/gamma-HCH transport system substrate-binding protein